MILLPKKDIIQSFSYIRPISQTNFLNKVISRVLHYTFEDLLPTFISKSQLDFVKGRNITDNFFLAKKIISDIKKRENPTNVMIKIDMTKACNRID